MLQPLVESSEVTQAMTKRVFHSEQEVYVANLGSHIGMAGATVRLPLFGRQYWLLM
jgi:hypothetical protein